MNIQNQCSYSSILLGYFEFEMWRSGKPWTVYYLMLTSQSAVPSQGVYIQSWDVFLHMTEPTEWWDFEAEVSGILGFEGLLWCASKLTRNWVEWQTTLEYSWLTIIVILLLSISCFNRASFFGGWGVVVGRRIAFESVSGFWGVVMSTWPLLPLAGGLALFFPYFFVLGFFFLTLLSHILTFFASILHPPFCRP